MASSLKEKYCILWDLTTCKSKSITSISQQIRQRYVSSNCESEFWCFTIKTIKKQKELEFKNDIKIIQKERITELYTILTRKINSFISKSVNDKFMPKVILISEAQNLTSIIEDMKSCAHILLIYGENAPKELIRLAPNKIPFESLELFAQNNNDSNNCLSSTISIDVENYSSNDSKVKSKSKSIKNC
jgi:hypothetical protein